MKLIYLIPFLEFRIIKNKLTFYILIITIIYISEINSIYQFFIVEIYQFN